MSRLEWIKDLAQFENQAEETGLIDPQVVLNSERILVEHTLRLLTHLKNSFIESATAFNQWKSSPNGRIKVYGIAKTHGDFMLFRNGFKMVFSMKAAGSISVRYNFIVSGPLAAVPASQHNTSSVEEHLLQAQMSPYGDVQWTFQDKVVTQDSILRYHFTLFVKESSQ